MKKFNRLVEEAYASMYEANDNGFKLMDLIQGVQKFTEEQQYDIVLKIIDDIIEIAKDPDDDDELKDQAPSIASDMLVLRNTIQANAGVNESVLNEGMISKFIGRVVKTLFFVPLNVLVIAAYIVTGFLPKSDELNKIRANFKKEYFNNTWEKYKSLMR